MTLFDFYEVYLIIGMIMAVITFIWFVISPMRFKKLFVGSERINFNIWDTLLVCVTSIIFWPFFVLLIILTFISKK